MRLSHKRDSLFCACFIRTSYRRMISNSSILQNIVPFFGQPHNFKNQPSICITIYQLSQDCRWLSKRRCKGLDCEDDSNFIMFILHPLYFD